MTQKGKLYLVLLLGLGWLAGCYASYGVSDRNISRFYKHQFSTQKKVQYTFYHYSRDSSYLFAKVPVSLIQISADTARLLIDYKVGKTYKFKEVIAAGSLQRTFYEKLPEQGYVTIREPIKIPLGRRYVFKATFYNKQTGRAEQHFKEIDRHNKHTQNHFLVQSVEQDLPLFQQFLAEQQTVTVEYHDADVKHLQVRYYRAKFPPAPPPFMEEYDFPGFFYLPWDSSFKISSGTVLKLEKPGIYHFLADTTQKYGCTLYRYENSYPNVHTTETMARQLRYMTTKKEYAQLLAAENKKAAVDSFWLGLSGSVERAKFLIHNYYSRVEQANQLFHSYKEGWKTDRGMIYMIFGQPDDVYRSMGHETWVYRGLGPPEPLEFHFFQRKNILTQNDYILKRDVALQNSWFQSVRNWRLGRIEQSTP